MFPQLKKLNNESGIVLFMVLMVAIMIMIFSVGILTQSSNEVNYAQQQIDQIVSDELAKGVFWNAYSSGMTNLPGTMTIPMAGSGRTYQVTITSGASSNGINSYTTTANYDSFQ